MQKRGIVKSLTLGSLLLALSLTATAQSTANPSSGAPVISSPQFAALREAAQHLLPAFTAARAELPTGLIFNCSAPKIELISLRRLSDTLAQATVRCNDSRVLPVTLWLHGSTMPTESAATRTPLPQTSKQHSSLLSSTSPSTQKTSPLLRAGARVLLEITEPGMKLSFPAICLESGSAGETIRVRDSADGREFRATIITAALLRMEISR